MHDLSLSPNLLWCSAKCRQGRKLRFFSLKMILCRILVHMRCTFVKTNKLKIMKNTLDTLSSVISSESSLETLMGMISDMDLEIKDIKSAKA
jgi:hypothetical protein